MANTVVLTPIYLESLPHNEALAMRHSLSVLQMRDICFICPAGLDVSKYQSDFPMAKYRFFDKQYFVSTDSYSTLLLSKEFYRAFSAYSHMLIVQTDCMIFRDDLDAWTASRYDYVGAPWAKVWEYVVPNLGTHLDGMKFFVTVGNGGLSLRRIDATLRVIEELAWLTGKFQNIVEDAFFSLAGHISTDFIVPNMISAARFSIECEPRRFFAMAGGLPMGVHAWERWDKPFWLERFEQLQLDGFR